MTYELIGTIKKIGDLQTFPSGFEKRELVVCDDDPRFPQEIPFGFTRERTKLLDQFAEGEKVKISFDIRGREYNGRHFVDLNAWRIEKDAAADSPAAGMPAAPAPAAYAAAPAAPAAQPPAPPAPGGADASLDDLPF